MIHNPPTKNLLNLDDDRYLDDFESPSNQHNISTSSFISPSTTTHTQLHAIQQVKELQAMLESITHSSTSSTTSHSTSSIPLPLPSTQQNNGSTGNSKNNMIASKSSNLLQSST